jgi:transcriptional antiterminator NusG
MPFLRKGKELSVLTLPAQLSTSAPELAAPTQGSNWFVLQCRTGSEGKVQRLLHKVLPGDEFQPFIPMKVWPFMLGGVIQKRQKPCFPGYLFVQSVMPPLEVRGLIPLIYQFTDAFCFLNYGADRLDMALMPQERSNLEKLLGDEFCMEPSTGFLEGDRVRVITGALAGSESLIKKINKRKKTAIIEVPLFGALREVSLMLELMEKA